MEKYSWSDPPGQFAFPIAKAGFPVVAACAFATVVFALLGFAIMTVIGLIVTFCVCGFFRDPDRAIPEHEAAIVSPADGKVIFAGTTDESPLNLNKVQKISIFMSVFNVHVNRIPCEGKITKVDYHPGKFFAANLDKASQQNEHNAVFLETRSGKEICFVQIAGLIARRIICYIKPGDQVLKGQRFGIICFGSRLDVFLPDDVQIDVRVGENVKAGTSILGRSSPQHP
jgi:phosphatidylserine decarboxylase